MVAKPKGTVLLLRLTLVGEVRDSGYQLAYRRAITNF